MCQLLTIKWFRWVEIVKSEQKGNVAIVLWVQEKKGSTTFWT